MLYQLTNIQHIINIIHKKRKHIRSEIHFFNFLYTHTLFCCYASRNAKKYLLSVREIFASSTFLNKGFHGLYQGLLFERVIRFVKKTRKKLSPGESRVSLFLANKLESIFLVENFYRSLKFSIYKN